MHQFSQIIKTESKITASTQVHEQKKKDMKCSQPNCTPIRVLRNYDNQGIVFPNKQ